MPELAKVEQIRGKVESFLLNKKIIGVTARKDDKVFCYKQPNEINQALLNKTIMKVCRKGKHLWFELDKAPHIAFHFGMTGKIKYETNSNSSNFTPPYYKLVLKLNNNTFIGYTSKSRLGKIRIHNNLPNLCEPIKDLGYDPQHNMCTQQEFIDFISKKKQRSQLKPALMDQHFICGIGSWIADEICYQSGIIPNVLIKELNEKQLIRIYCATVEICNYSLSVNGYGTQYPSNWLFHYRWFSSKGKSAVNHYDGDGNKITTMRVNKRFTVYVIGLQTKNGLRNFQNSTKKGKIVHVLTYLDDKLIDSDNETIMKNNNNNSSNNMDDAEIFYKKQLKIKDKIIFLLKKRLKDNNIDDIVHLDAYEYENIGSANYKENKLKFKKKLKQIKMKQKLKTKSVDIKVKSTGNTTLTPLRRSKRISSTKCKSDNH